MSEIVKYNETSLDLVEVPTWEQAEAAARHLDIIGRNVAFWWGDFLNYCEDVFPETWTQLIPDIGWTPKTLQNWKWVCANVRKNARYETLSFGHHETVAGLDPEDQDHFLKLAAEANLTVSDLRKEIRGPQPEKPPKIRVVSCTCPECQHRFDQEVTG